MSRHRSEQGADNLLYHLEAARESRTGKVFNGRREHPLPAYWQDEEVSGKLWSVTESMLADAVP